MNTQNDESGDLWAYEEEKLAVYASIKGKNLTLGQVLAQRDELLAALERVKRSDAFAKLPFALCNVVNDAIANAEGSK